MTGQKPSSTEPFVHQILGTLVNDQFLNDDLPGQIARDAETSSFAQPVRRFDASAPSFNNAIVRLAAFRATWNEATRSLRKAG